MILKGFHVTFLEACRLFVVSTGTCTGAACVAPPLRHHPGTCEVDTGTFFAMVWDRALDVFSWLVV